MNVSDLFSPDTKFYRFFEMLWELLALNLLYIATSLPIVTIGISTTALCQSVMAMMKDEKPLSVYFSVWKTDWKQATGIWMLLLALLAAICAYIYLFVLVPESPSFWVLLVIIAMMLIFLAVAGWVFPLLAQFNNTTANHLKNAAVLAIAHPIKSLMMAVLMLVPIVVILISPYWFFRLGFIWISVGASGICYLNLKIIRPAMQMMIRKARKEAGLDDEPDELDEGEEESE